MRLFVCYDRPCDELFNMESLLLGIVQRQITNILHASHDEDSTTVIGILERSYEGMTSGKGNTRSLERVVGPSLFLFSTDYRVSIPFRI